MSLIGYEAVLYYNNGTSESPTWLPIDTVRDVTVTMEANDVDDTSRTTNGWRSRKQGLKQWGSDFEMIYETSNTAWQLVRASFFNGTPIEILALDQDISVDGAEGLRGSVEITNFEKGEPLEDVQTNSTTFAGNGTPVWVVANGGSVSPKDPTS
jgi:predicted secreted protein